MEHTTRYIREIPRDLFNEGNLLKCLGQLVLLKDKFPSLHIKLESPTSPFEIYQDPSDGSIYANNIFIRIGKTYLIHARPLNARSPYPLYVAINYADTTPEIPVFNDDGTPHEDFLKLYNTLQTE